MRLLKGNGTSQSTHRCSTCAFQQHPLDLSSPASPSPIKHHFDEPRKHYTEALPGPRQPCGGTCDLCTAKSRNISSLLSLYRPRCRFPFKMSVTGCPGSLMRCDRVTYNIISSIEWPARKNCVALHCTNWCDINGRKLADYDNWVMGAWRRAALRGYSETIRGIAQHSSMGWNSFQPLGK